MRPETLAFIAAALTAGLGEAAPQSAARSFLDFNKDVLGDSPGRPAGHETTPYREGLRDPYTGFSDKANPHDVLGE